jgi:hypothetical protein
MYRRPSNYSECVEPHDMQGLCDEADILQV